MRCSIGFSALQRAEIAEIVQIEIDAIPLRRVSVLFNEPKLLKYTEGEVFLPRYDRFSALQRAEIAEILFATLAIVVITVGFSALQRAEIAEMR